MVGARANQDTRNITEAIALYHEGNYAQALALLMAAVPGSPWETTEVPYYAGLCCMRLKRQEDALGYLEQVVTSDVSLERVRQCRILLAVVYALTGRERLADFELRKLLDTGYKKAVVYGALAYIAWIQKKPEDAAAYYEMALTEDETSVTAVNGMGYVLACMGKNLPRAISLCKQAVGLAPESAACLDSLGWAYFKMGLLSDAKSFVKQAQSLDGENIEIKSHLEAILAEERARQTPEEGQRA
ncbi:MAG: tetratricopeptide repeat protein [Spirochaetaceae bacterium]|nr:tetratricopeptide repeat protein [Spirochaetaceae bacterium]